MKIFSRNQEDNTPKFPDVIRAMPRFLKPGVKSVVIDAEAVAFDRGSGKILPFQILSTRGTSCAFPKSRHTDCPYNTDTFFSLSKSVRSQGVQNRGRGVEPGTCFESLRVIHRV